MTGYSTSGEGIVFNKKDKALQKEVNQEISKLKKNGKLSKIAKKYYGADVTKKVKVKSLKHFTIKKTSDN